MNRGEFLDKPVGAMPTMLQFPKEPLDHFTGENPHLVTNFICCFFCIAIIIRYHLLLRSLHTFRCILQGFEQCVCDVQQRKQNDPWV